MIVADTGAVLALLDADDRHHAALRAVFDEQPGAWRIPWAVLPEVDYLAATQLGSRVALAFIEDLAEGHYIVEWGHESDIIRARELCTKYRDLQIGLVDAVVIAIAERRDAHAIATLDLRDFGAVKIRGKPKLIPRDL